MVYILEPITETHERNFCVEMMKRLNIHSKGTNASVMWFSKLVPVTIKLVWKLTKSCYVHQIRSFTTLLQRHERKERRSDTIGRDEQSCDELSVGSRTCTQDIHEHNAFDLLAVYM